MRVYIGIDPGLHGAIGVVSELGEYVVVFDTPTIALKTTGGKIKTRYDVDKMRGILFSDIAHNYDIQLVTIEEVAARPGQGVTSMFNFGFGYGLWTGLVVALKCLRLLVYPQVWKAKMALLDTTKGEVLDEARARWPSAPLTLQKHDGRADALFLAYYGWTQATPSPLTVATRPGVDAVETKRSRFKQLLVGEVGTRV